MVETSAPRRLANQQAAFAAAAAALIVVTIGANMPPPLFPRYVDAYGLSALEVTSIFATYTLYIAPTLLVFGPFRTPSGRRPVLVFALVTAAAADRRAWRGAETSGGCTSDARSRASPSGRLPGPGGGRLGRHPSAGRRGEGPRWRGPATCVGTAVGPMTAGVLAQYFPAPLHLSFVVELALVVVALAALLAELPVAQDATRPSRSRSAGRRFRRPSDRPSPARRTRRCSRGWSRRCSWPWRRPSSGRLSTPTTASCQVAIVALMLVSSVLCPARRSRTRPGDSPGPRAGPAHRGARGVSWARRRRTRCRSARVSAAVTGAGQGLAFSGAAQAVGTIAPSERRGNVMSLFFVAIYLGVTVAIVGLGLLATRLGLLPAVQLFSVVASVGCVASIVSHVRASARPRKMKEWQ